ncbi:MAG: IS1 family transposase [Sedimentisphaerales bacterium]|nr:IS1 family transposase [Sedimentisphaerales bacterium]
MNKLTIQKQAQVLGALVEGNSIRSTVRMTGAAKNTVVKLLCDVGRACEQYQDKIMINLPCKKIQVDEIWSFCYAKNRNVPEKYLGKQGYGDVWTWVALDPDTKLVPCWLVGGRSKFWAKRFMYDLAWRMAGRIQLTTDAYAPYYNAVCEAFKDKVDYAQLMKLYGVDRTQDKIKYSPPRLLYAMPKTMIGRPDQRHISTSYVERQNLTMRMQMKRFARLTNGFSKKIENLYYAVALHFMNYNFCRIHKTLGVTPVMAIGLSTHLWKLEDILDLLKK